MEESGRAGGARNEGRLLVLALWGGWRLEATRRIGYRTCATTTTTTKNEAIHENGSNALRLLCLVVVVVWVLGL